MLEFYPTQAVMISRTRKAIKESKPICIDSPTGTGKTRILLLSILPFVDTTKLNTGISVPITSAITLNNLERVFNSEPCKIFYVSRTHSQLNQVLDEIRHINKLHYKTNSDKLINVSAIVLGNRQLYCSSYEGDIEEINKKCKNGDCEYKEAKKYHIGNTDFSSYVASLYDKKFDHDEINNENCELQDSDDFGMASLFKIPPKKSYLFDTKTLNCLADAKNKEVINTGIREIPKRFKTEANSNFCPYYFTKHFVTSCPLTFLTYSSMINLFTRKSYQINLEGSIVIFDEAHNLFDMLISQNTAEILYFNLNKLNYRLQSFFNEEIQRCKSKRTQIKFELKSIKSLITNILKIEQIVFNKFINSGHKKFILFIKEENRKTLLLSHFNECSSLILSLSVTDFQKTVDILEYNTLPLVEYLQTVSFFRDQIESDMINFLRLLTESNINCRLHISFDMKSAESDVCKIKSLKIFPLDPSIYFKPFSDAKSIIFSGGTMEPYTLLNTLVPNIELIKGGAVCNDFLPVICTHYDQIDFNLTYANRGALFEPIKQSLESFLTLSSNTVVFFTSKEIMKTYENIKTDKHAFFDDFEGYRNTIQRYKSSNVGKYAVLYTVLGGALSEGINFADDLCRLLIIVGVPYPTLEMALYERQQYYKNQDIDIMKCMAFKTVNQALGRALRHKNDWASMVLIDSRYKTQKNNITSWIQKKLKEGSVNECKLTIQEFIKEKDVLL
ncbi:ATP-dependent DNA helicase DDX11 [Cucumispora dikerogammari]|nr:ATP-dependent DNA helicase DDX11 [Cucumispora dikerogammari]